MNNTQPNLETPLTLSAALLLTQQDLEDSELSRSDFSLTVEQGRVAAALWVALQGLDADSDAASTARNVALNDDALIVALHRPASEFLRWWRAAEWEHFGCDDAEVWGWNVLDRARSATLALGVLASQVALTARAVLGAAAGGQR